MKPDTVKSGSGLSRGSRILRHLSILAAAAVVILIVLYPRAVASDGTSVPHGWLVLLMMGMSVCWVYGLGFVPQNRWLRLTFSPAVGWLMLAVGVWQVFF